MNTDTVDIQEAADILKVHPQTVADLISQGAIPAAKIGRAYVMMRRDVVRFAELQIINQTAKRIGTPGKSSTRRRKGAAE